jgi:hypothetical protein
LSALLALTVCSLFAASPGGASLDYTAPPAFRSTDWIQVLIDRWDGPRAGVRPMPHDVARTRSPFFVWPHVGTDSTRYQVNLRPVGGPTTTLQPDRNGRAWLDPGDLPPGAYEWRVQHPGTLAWSDWRPFSVAPNAVAYVVPSAATIAAYATARPRPRSMPDDLAARLIKFRPGGELYLFTAAAKSKLAGMIGQSLFWEDSLDFSHGLLGNQLERIPAFWWLWLIEGDTTQGRVYRDEALRRLRWFSAPYTPTLAKGFLLTAAGKTSYFNQDINATNLTRFLAFGWDAMSPLLSGQEKAELLAAIGFRLHEMTTHLGAFPMRNDCLENSHNIVGTMFGALVGLSLIGDPEVAAIPTLNADVTLWAHNADQVLKTYNSFADQDGCHWHNLGYASTTFDRAQSLDMLSNAAGVDFFASPRALGIVESHMRMFPPDNTGPDKAWNKPFGDSVEGGEWGNVLAFEPIYGTPEMARYSQMKGATLADYAVINEWFIARKAPSASTTATAFPAVVYPGAGMGAFHSNPLDPQRTSLWFRSSQEGADNHRHLDQNSFVLSARGQPLFLDAGYYGQYGDDDYASAHRANFAKRSIAHNTIALDGRSGQQRFHTTPQPTVMNELAARRARGRILRFVDTPEYGFVVGDALQAYQQVGYEHTKALRAVVYLRPNIVLVFDAHDLSGPARSWNWLFHSLQPPVDAGGFVTLTAGAAVATVRNLHASPAITGRTIDDNRWPAGASPGAGAPPQWHNSFDFAPATALRSCMLIEVQSPEPVTAPVCTSRGTTLIATLTASGRRWTVTFDPASGGVTVTGLAGVNADNIPPAQVQGPASTTVTQGQPATFSLVATGSPSPVYQWRKDGVDIAGATSTTLSINSAQASDAGSYTVVITNAAGSITSNAATLTVNSSRLINFSILTSFAAAGDIFTLGYVVGGSGTSGPKPLVIRAAGPSLGSLGVTGPLEDPKFECFAGSVKTAENDNWGGAGTLAHAMAAVGAFAYAGPTSRDAAAARSVASGDHSVKVSAVGNATGAVLAEVYDATPEGSFTSTTPRLINVSVLKQVGPGFTVGFVVGGSGTKNVLVRAIGPTLGSAFGVPGAVSDPQFTLFSGQTAMTTNDNWGGGSTLGFAFASVGAFALPATSRDAAVLASLGPGNYTVQVSGFAGATGMILVEVYELP